MQDLRLLEYFVGVADELNFTRAAQTLHVTPSTISAGVRKLERRLGLQLFDRDSRSVALTADGRRLLGDARRTLEAADHFDRRARAVDGRIELVVGTFWGLGADRLDQAARHAVGAGIDLHLDLRVYGWDDPTGGLRQRDVDVAVVPGPSDIDERLRRLPLWEEPRVAILPNDSPLARRGHVELADLDAVGWARFPDPDLVAHPWWRLDHLRGGPPAERGRVHETPHELMLAIRNGHGTCTTLASFRDQFSFEGLTLVPLEGVPLVPVDLAHRLDRIPPGLRTLRDGLRPHVPLHL